MSLPTVKFKHWHCYLAFCEYENGRVALALKELETHDLIAKATVNIPEYPLNNGEVIIKDHGENEGMLSALVDAGVVKPTGWHIKFGHVEGPVCELLVKQEVW